MPSNQTPNYQLSQWEKSDKVLMDDFNADNAKIDAAIKAEADARSAQVSVLNAALNKCGNCQIWTTSYAGNDLYGASNPCTLTFPGKPLVVFIGECGAGYNNTGIFACILQGQTTTFAQSHFIAGLTLTWGENSLSWSNHESAVSQLNSASRTYTVVALMEA
ncbi:MAG: hypothetical protein HFF44_03545 [Lawsonibacter sp.]|nr:hypothetical protein [Lawsonibacter sp.]